MNIQNEFKKVKKQGVKLAKKYKTKKGSVYDLEESEAICPKCDIRLYGDGDE